jgi:hypothetical protein
VPYADQFEVNDEGFLVWVGDHHYWEGAGPDGIAGTDDDLWGTVSPVIGTRTYNWGMPIAEQNAEFNNLRQLMGEANAVNFGWLHNVRVGPFNFHAQFQAAYGGDANNRHHQLLTDNTRATAPKMDQRGKPEQLKKPIQYFREANDGDASYYIEDASYLKLRTLSASYQMNQDAIQRFGLDRIGLQSVSIGLIARNIFTITNYDGFDPEQALNLNDRQNADGGGYPPTRNLTAEITVTF